MGVKNVVLETLKMEGSHTGKNIADTLQKTKQRWSLPNIVATTDNAANERKAFDILKWDRFVYYGHRLNLVVKKALTVPEIDRLLGKGRKLVTLFHTSTSVMDKLREKQAVQLTGDAAGHTLIADVPTRWNSTLQMLRRLIEHD